MGGSQVVKKFLIFALLSIGPILNNFYIESVFYLYSQSMAATAVKILYFSVVIFVRYKFSVRPAYLFVIVLMIFWSNIKYVLVAAWISLVGFV